MGIFQVVNMLPRFLYLFINTKNATVYVVQDNDFCNFSLFWTVPSPVGQIYISSYTISRLESLIFPMDYIRVAIPQT